PGHLLVHFVVSEAYLVGVSDVKSAVSRSLAGPDSVLASRQPYPVRILGVKSAVTADMMFAEVTDPFRSAPQTLSEPHFQCQIGAEPTISTENRSAHTPIGTYSLHI
ncbi:hypothetical protein, partial [Allokutzneria oryzae]